MQDTPAAIPIVPISGPTPDPYQAAVERVYQDPPDRWRPVIGEAMWFQFGVYDQGTSLDEAGARHFEIQLDLAGIEPPRRVLELGPGWGTATSHLATRFPNCPRLDIVNVSRPQLDHAARRLARAGLAGRVNLYLCAARDVDRLPDPDEHYDLVLLRGAIVHLSPEILEETLAGLARRMSPGGTVVISEHTYADLDRYRSAIPDPDDRLASGHRKTVTDLTRALDRHGFVLRDLRQLPSAGDSIRWLTDIGANVARHYPGADRPKVFAELADHARNWSSALRTGQVAVSSLIATFGPATRSDQSRRTRAVMPSFGTTVHLPPVELTLPVLRHPGGDEAERRTRIADQPYLEAHYGNAEAVAAFAAHRVPVLASLCWPHAEGDRIFHLQRALEHIAMLDDEFARPDVLDNDDQCAVLREDHLNVLDGAAPRAGAPLAKLFSEVLASVLADVRPAAGARLVTAIRKQIENLAARPALQVDALSLDQYLVLRRVDFFLDWMAALTEYALGIDMSGGPAGHPDLTALRDTAFDLTVLFGDLYSLRKEAAERDPLNAVWLVMRDEHLDLQEAVDALAGRCEVLQRHLVGIRDRILGSALGEHAAVRRYVPEIVHLHTGICEFHRVSKRYQGLGFSGSRFDSGDLTIEPYRTPASIADQERRHRPFDS
ncbi:methyltransferase domain-containing protein [Streptomyces sp. SUK 48]|uniref:terpene synthase family protein n=1 Tax=Streptomyces sp. SUK 48 TaxID=2582831 RepID=UPI001ABBDCBC|nr:methyltransferase domain-containing protein [Streptomyces sp. SUK 48]